MTADLLTIGLAFIEGVALIVSPCILPILPIILSGSFTGSRSRPLGIIAGFVITFSIITLFAKFLVNVTGISQEALRNASFMILFLLGVVMLSPYLTEKFNLLTQRLTRVGSSLTTANNPQSGFWGGLVFGSLVGIIWTPCAGPILAAVIVQIIVAQTTLGSVFALIAFAIGAGLPMLFIAFIGRALINRFHFVVERAVFFRQMLGLIIIFSVVFLAYSSNVFSVTFTAKTNITTPTTLLNGLDKPYQAPDFSGIETWINSQPLTMQALRGKVVLIDFWTYSCINCIRTLPYLKDWYAKYHDKGFEIIGVHSPEFQFERDVGNVKNAVQKYGILYPVALDNRFETWRRYHNRYWPAHYLINKKGEVVYQHFGEGEYDVTEGNIRYLLDLSGQAASVETKETRQFFQTPETYLGYDRAENNTSIGNIIKNHVAHYQYPRMLSQNQWALNGRWIVYAEKVVAAEANASIKLYFNARSVYAVMGARTGLPIQVKVLFNGRPIAVTKGTDITDGVVTVKQNQLYTLIEGMNAAGGILELIALSPGLEIYTFTFG